MPVISQIANSTSSPTTDIAAAAAQKRRASESQDGAPVEKK